MIMHDRRRTKERTYYWSTLVTTARSKEEMSKGERPKVYIVTVAIRSDDLRVARRLAHTKIEHLPFGVRGMVGAYIQCNAPDLEVPDMYELTEPITVMYNALD